MKEKLKILVLGDIVGRPGRVGVARFLEKNKKNYDFVIANIENASHGYGLTRKNYEELSACGIDIMTSGNHIWDKKEIFDYINEAPKLLRPLNYPSGTPGKGSKIIKTSDSPPISVINIAGTVFMPCLIPPWELLSEEIKKIKEEAKIIIIDHHAETTAEKISCGYFAAEKGVTAVLGTHTHVQTADEKILEGTTAFISDIGFCGAYRSVIGMQISDSVGRLVKMLPGRLEIGPMATVQINGVELFINPESGHAEQIKRINVVMDFSDEVNE